MSWCLFIALGVEQCAFAATNSSNYLKNWQLQLSSILHGPSELQIPQEYAKLTDYHQGSNGRLIIHIQDPHGNLSGQQSIANTLESLMSKYDIDLILSEGGEGDVSLGYAKDGISQKDLKIGANRLLHAGLIAGHEYFNLVSDRAMRMVGIEDMELYRKNLRAYQGLVIKRSEVLLYLRQMQISLQRIKNKRYPKELLLYEDIPSAEVLQEIQSLAEMKREGLSNFPSIQSLLVSQKKANTELPELNFHQLLMEIKELRDEIYQKKLPSTQLQTLRAIDEYILILQKAYQIQMSNEDYALYKAYAKVLPMASAQAFMNQELLALRYYEDLVHFEPYIEEGSDSIEEFYQLVHQRDLAFMQRIDHYTQQNANGMTVLIAGGYHTQHLKQLLKHEGYSYAVLTPHVSVSTDYEDYEQHLLSGLSASESDTIPQALAAMTGESAPRMALMENDAYAGRLVRNMLAKQQGPLRLVEFPPARLITQERASWVNDDDVSNAKLPWRVEVPRRRVVVEQAFDFLNEISPPASVVRALTDKRYALTVNGDTFAVIRFDQFSVPVTDLVNAIPSRDANISPKKQDGARMSNVIDFSEEMDVWKVIEDRHIQQTVAYVQGVTETRVLPMASNILGVTLKTLYYRKNKDANFGKVDLPKNYSPRTIKEVRREAVIRALALSNSKIVDAAKKLGVSRQKISDDMKKFDITAEEVALHPYVFLQAVKQAFRDSELENLSKQEFAMKVRVVREQVRLKTLSSEEAKIKASALFLGAASNVLGYMPTDSQIVASLMLTQGKLIEMEPGEGKTLTIAMATYVATFTGGVAHVHTFNDHLAKQNAVDMGELFYYLDKKLVVLGGEDMNDPKKLQRKIYEWHGPTEAYPRGHLKLMDDSNEDELKKLKHVYNFSHIIYGASNEFIADHLVGKQSPSYEQMVLPNVPPAIVIVDEADSVLLDEASNPLILSSNKTNIGKKKQKRLQTIDEIFKFAKKLYEGKDFSIGESDGVAQPSLTDRAAKEFEEVLNYYELDKSQVNQWLGAALDAIHYKDRDVHYVVMNDRLIVVDQLSGTLQPSHRLPNGLHEMLEVKEKLKINPPIEIQSMITYPSFYQNTAKESVLAGATGTIGNDAQEIRDKYGLETVWIAPQQEVRTENLPIHIHNTEVEKRNAVSQRVIEINETGAPILIFVASILEGKLLRERLVEEHGPEVEVVDGTDTDRETEILMHAGERGKITIGTNRMGRGVNIPIDDAMNALGGLHVIETAANESERLDDQHAKRAGRRGQNGAVEHHVSLEDPLVTKGDYVDWQRASEEKRRSVRTRLQLQDEAITKHRQQYWEYRQMQLVNLYNTQQFDKDKLKNIQSKLSEVDKLWSTYLTGLEKFRYDLSMDEFQEKATNLFQRMERQMKRAQSDDSFATHGRAEMENGNPRSIDASATTARLAQSRDDGVLRTNLIDLLQARTSNQPLDITLYLDIDNLKVIQNVNQKIGRILAKDMSPGSKIKVVKLLADGKLHSVLGTTDGKEFVLLNKPTSSDEVPADIIQSMPAGVGFGAAVELNRLSEDELVNSALFAAYIKGYENADDFVRSEQERRIVSRATSNEFDRNILSSMYALPDNIEERESRMATIYKKFSLKMGLLANAVSQAARMAAAIDSSA